MRLIARNMSVQLLLATSGLGLLCLGNSARAFDRSVHALSQPVAPPIAPRVSRAVPPGKPRPVASTAELKLFRKYRACVITAAKRSASARQQTSDAALSALYSCPDTRAEAQALLISIYGFTRTSSLFDAVDQRLLREAQVVMDGAHHPRSR